MAKRRANEEFGTYIEGEVKKLATFDFTWNRRHPLRRRSANRNSKNENVGHKQQSDLNE